MPREDQAADPEHPDTDLFRVAPPNSLPVAHRMSADLP
jgi:hypothetical protein